MFEETYLKLKKKLTDLISGFFIMLFNIIFTNVLFLIFNIFEEKIILRAVKLTEKDILYIIDNTNNTINTFFEITLINFFKNSYYYLKEINYNDYENYINKFKLNLKKLKIILLDKILAYFLLIILCIIIYIYIYANQDYHFHSLTSGSKMVYTLFSNFDILSYQIYSIILFLFNLFIFIHIFNHIDKILKDYILDENINKILFWLLGSFGIIVLGYYFSFVYIN